MPGSLPWKYKKSLGCDGNKVDKDTAKAIANQAGLHATNNTGDTPLIVAALLGHGDMVRWLLDAGADVNYVPDTGWGDTPLHAAAEQNRGEAVECLLEAGANPNATNKRGLTPLDVAFTNTFADPRPAARALLEYGARITETTRKNGLDWDPVAFREFLGEPVPPEAYQPAEEPPKAGLQAGYTHINTDADIADWIWEHLIPRSGEADTIQGELLRAVRNLRDEAHRNGNGNWCHMHEAQVDTLEAWLTSAPCFTEDQCRQTRSAIRRLRDYDHPYIKDDLFDYLEELVVIYSRANPELIPNG